jgi:aspartate aminotransferase
MSISENVQRRMVDGSAIRRMFEEGNVLKKRFGEGKVFDLSIGNPIIEPPAKFKTELKRLSDHPMAGMHRYMENAGYTETRTAVASQLSKETNCKFTLNDIVMTCGAAGAINVILKTLLNPGEEVIVFSPYFLEFDNYIDNHGGVTKVVPTDEQFIPDLIVLEKAITAKTKAVIINSPNNPTGVVYSTEFISLLGKLLMKKEKEYSTTIFLISDEAYRKIIYDGLIYPQVFHHYTQSIVAYSHSKDLALPGERIGFIAIHPDCVRHNELIGGFIFSNRVLGFVNAPALMQHIIQNLQGITVPISDYQKKRDFLYSRLRELGYSLVKPQGAFYMFPKSPLEDELVFVKELMEHNILVVPGRSFGTHGYFRIAYCVNDKTLEGCIAGFRKIAQQHKLC